MNAVVCQARRRLPGAAQVDARVSFRLDSLRRCSVQNWSGKDDTLLLETFATKNRNFDQIFPSFAFTQFSDWSRQRSRSYEDAPKQSWSFECKINFLKWQTGLSGKSLQMFTSLEWITVSIDFRNLKRSLFTWRCLAPPQSFGECSSVLSKGLWMGQRAGRALRGDWRNRVMRTICEHRPAKGEMPHRTLHRGHTFNVNFRTQKISATKLTSVILKTSSNS